MANESNIAEINAQLAGASTVELDDAYIAHTYGRFPVNIVSGKGSIVFDEAGKRYIDLGSGIAVNTFGVADEAWQQAVVEQISKVQHTSNLYYSEPCAKLAAMLCKRTGMARVFFGNSGAEANECAIKVARKYAQDKYGAQKYRILTLCDSFHGRTLTTLAATGQDHFHELFNPLTPGFESIPAGNIEAAQQAFAQGDVAGVLFECVQGEGGVNVIDPAYLQQLAALAHEYDALVMVDEVQTGNGRTGTLYAYEQFGIEPDVFTTAKGLAGGLPIGACVMSAKVANVFGPGDHGSTFGGNPVSCAAALSVLARIDEELLAQVQAKEALVRQRLEGAPGVQGVFGKGLLLGIVPERPLADAVAALRERGVLVLTAKNKIRLLPALNIPIDVLEEALDIIEQVLAEE